MRAGVQAIREELNVHHTHAYRGIGRTFLDRGRYREAATDCRTPVIEPLEHSYWELVAMTLASTSCSATSQSSTAQLA